MITVSSSKTDKHMFLPKYSQLSIKLNHYLPLRSHLPPNDDQKLRLDPLVDRVDPTPSSDQYFPKSSYYYLYFPLKMIRITFQGGSQAAPLVHECTDAPPSPTHHDCQLLVRCSIPVATLQMVTYGMTLL
jgi:hypothetical protein